MCWVALDRALRARPIGERCRRARAAPVAHRGRRRSVTFVEEHCWSDELRSYTRIAGGRDVDASLLMLPIVEYDDGHGERIRGTVDAVVRLLRHEDVVYQLSCAMMACLAAKGCFLNCSFWLVGALARGTPDEATALMEQAGRAANDVGLFAEEIDPESGAFLGNFPQALVHLALIDAAIAISKGGVVITSALAGGVIGTLGDGHDHQGRDRGGDDPDGPGAAARHRGHRQPPQGARAFGYIFYFACSGSPSPEAYGAFFAIVGHAFVAARCAAPVHCTRCSSRRCSSSVLLPVVHPRMATTDTAANETTLPIEPPGFLMLNYGRSTFLSDARRAHRLRALSRILIVHRL